MEGRDKNPMDFGGNNILALTTLANGCGIVTEQLVPYADSDGGLDKEGDWSLPEIMRYAVSIELKNANLLPAPAGGPPAVLPDHYSTAPYRATDGKKCQLSPFFVYTGEVRKSNMFRQGG